MKSQTSTIDPVCQTTVNPVDESIKAVFKGNIFFFCASTCKDKFIANPQRYLDNLKPKKKGFWQRYLDKINKATGGKPPSCCQ